MRIGCHGRGRLDSVTPLLVNGTASQTVPLDGALEVAAEKRDVIEGVITQISGSFHQLELTDEQEQYFISLIENQLHKKTVSDEFLNVRETLDSCLSSITTAQNMTKAANEDQAESAQSDYQDVELF